jgi:hypothetical protein
MQKKLLQSSKNKQLGGDTPSSLLWGSAMEENLIQFAIDAITSYLTLHPGAADTIEGIHLWWIRWPNIPESILVTAAALEKLEQTGLIEHQSVGNRKIWRLPRATKT